MLMSLTHCVIAALLSFQQIPEPPPGQAPILKPGQNPFTTMIDQVYDSKKSRDGRFTAILYYNENAAMTFGYYHVDMIDAKEPKWRYRVAEVAAEGLSRLRWSGKRRLIVYYDPKEVTPDLWVKRTADWRGVRIQYRAEH